MLDIAKEPISLGQLVPRFLVNPFRLCQLRQRLLGAAATKCRHPATGDQLLCLREELDLADAAATELDVVALDRDRAMPLVGMDLALDGMNIGDGGVVEILAKDERNEPAQELLASLDIASDGARLDEGGTLPVLPLPS